MSRELITGSGVERFGDAWGGDVNSLIVCPRDSSIGHSTEKCEKGKHLKM